MSRTRRPWPLPWFTPCEPEAEPGRRPGGILPSTACSWEGTPVRRVGACGWYFGPYEWVVGGPSRGVICSQEFRQRGDAVYLFHSTLRVFLVSQVWPTAKLPAR